MSSPESDALSPAAYYQLRFPATPEPAFTDDLELSQRWGARWGSHDEVGRLRVVLMRRPGREFEQIDERAWDPHLGALIDPESRWYWTRRHGPDLARLRAQHDGLVRALQAEGVQVLEAEPIEPRFTKAIYTRDPLVSVPGGVVIGRLAPLMRRGEEASITRAAASAGVPVLRTIIGTGTLEGGSLVKLTPEVAAFGTSIRCNTEGAQQLAETLRWLEIELVVVPMSGFSIHLDGQLGMVDVDKALVNAAGLPYWFIERLRELGIEAIWADPAERWAVNCLTVRPGRVLMAADCPRTAERLERRGMEIVPIAYDEVHPNGGGIHCSTMELLREPA
jgi:N-dimethylarginine dimethylaminohydrolase